MAAERATCPACAEEVAELTARCPHCGELLRPWAVVLDELGSTAPDPAFAELLRSWPDESLHEAVNRYWSEYPAPRQAAVIAELERRGQRPDDRPTALGFTGSATHPERIWILGGGLVMSLASCLGWASFEALRRSTGSSEWLELGAVALALAVVASGLWAKAAKVAREHR